MGALRGERLAVAVAQEVTYMATALGMAAAGVGIERAEFWSRHTLPAHSP